MKSKIMQNFLQVSGEYLGLEASAVTRDLSMQLKVEPVHEDGLRQYLVAKHKPLAKYVHKSCGMQS